MDNDSNNKNMVKCKACGKDIAKGVKKCIHCGKDQRNFFMKHKILTFILAVLLIGIIGNALGGSDDNTSSDSSKQKEPVKQTTTDKPIEKEEEIIIVSAEDLAKEYEENEVRADKSYKGKLAEIKGTVKSIGVVMNSTYVVLSSGEDFSLTSIQCFFKDESEIDKIVDLSEGDVITVQGKIDGKSLNVSVNNCIIK